MKASWGRTAQFIAGGTALQLDWADGASTQTLIDVSALTADPPCWMEDGRLCVSAFARLEDVQRAGLPESGSIGLLAAIRSIAAFGIRSLATIGGNIAWMKGDLRPYMLAAGAELVTSDGSMSIEDWCARPSDSLIRSLRFPAGVAAVEFEKIGLRRAFTPSLVSLAYTETAGGLRIAVGGGANLAGRLRHFEAILAPSRPIRLSDARAAILSDGLLADDHVASASHRAEVIARVVLGRLGRSS